MELDVHDRQGAKVGVMEVADEVFGLKPNISAVHQTFVAQMANRRRGLTQVKTRGQVRGSTKKISRQKGLGRARQGSVRAPHRRGGGIVFGPMPRSYAQTLNKRVRRLAIRSALSGKAREGDLTVVDALVLEVPRTKEVAAMLASFEMAGSVVIVTAGADANVKLSAANLPRVTTLAAPYLNVADLLNHRHLVMTQDAVRVAELLWGGERASKRRAPLPEGAR